MPLDWARLIHERHDWETYNFPEVKIEHQLMGVMEEVGELAHHHLKMSQSIRNNEDHIAEGQDAVGDIIIYMLGVMHSMDMLEGPEIYSMGHWGEADMLVLILARDVGELINVHLNITIGSRYRVSRLILSLRRYCSKMEWDFEQIVEDTWNKVKKRDWKADPVQGVSPGSAIDLLREHDGDPDWSGL